MRFIQLIVCCLLLLLCETVTPAQAERRIALVVGNSAYRNVQVLDNPANDARLMADTLRTLNFMIVSGGAQINLDKTALVKALQSFSDQIQGADVALFYYAGHGVQVRGSNFLVPIDANPTREADIDFQMVDATVVLRQMEGAGTRLNLVILDACRNNPFGGRGLRATGSGLAQMQAPEGTLISYATQPGNVAQDGTGAHSPYTSALAQNIVRPGLDVFQTFNAVGLAVMQMTGGAQQPWISSSPIKGDFYFTTSATTPGSFLRQPLVRAAPCDDGTALNASLSLRPTCPLSAVEEHVLKPNDSFKECNACPEMVVIPAGSFTMGSPTSEPGRSDDEGPQHTVRFGRQFAVGRFALTFDEWDACVVDGGCNGYKPFDEGWGRGRRPVIHVNWEDAQAYLTWISRKVGKNYRLLSEAEREYVTRAGTTAPFWFGSSVSIDEANYIGTGLYGSSTAGFRRQTVPVDDFRPNPWGLYQVHGNVREWTEDCYNKTYQGAPNDGSAWTTGDCDRRVLRNGSWTNKPALLRSAFRGTIANSSVRSDTISFRVARTLLVH